MKLKPIIWRKVETGSFGTTIDVAFIGPLTVAKIHFNAIDRDESKKYVLQCPLPNLDKIRKFPTIEEAKEVAEKLVRAWFNSVTEPDVKDGNESKEKQS